MTILIDTQMLLWFQENNPKLKAFNKLLIEDINNTSWVSQISLLEIAIKLKAGRLPEFVENSSVFAKQMLTDGFQILLLQNEHIEAYDQIPFHEDHRDPFDRLILATALHENWSVMSADGKFSLYKDLVDVIW